MGFTFTAGKGYVENKTLAHYTKLIDSDIQPIQNQNSSKQQGEAYNVETKTGDLTLDQFVPFFNNAFQLRYWQNLCIDTNG